MCFVDKPYPCTRHFRWWTHNLNTHTHAHSHSSPRFTPPFFASLTPVSTKEKLHHNGFKVKWTDNLGHPSWSPEECIEGFPPAAHIQAVETHRVEEWKSTGIITEQIELTLPYKSQCPIITRHIIKENRTTLNNFQHTYVQGLERKCPPFSFMFA